MESLGSLSSSTSSFLNNNTFISKICFVILIIICFIILFNIGYAILAMIFAPNKSPYVIKGLVSGRELRVIKQQGVDSIPIYRSDDQNQGIEFTWSSWIYINGNDLMGQLEQRKKLIFVKGNYDPAENSENSINCPGVYLAKQDKNLQLEIIIDYFIHNSTKYNETINVPDIPISKWISLIIRCTKQDLIDIIINGSLVSRNKLQNVVRQNYGDVIIGKGGGFDGYISCLRYFNYSIGTFEIDQIVEAGPNLVPEKESNLSSGVPYYLSTKWLLNEIR